MKYLGIYLRTSVSESKYSISLLSLQFLHFGIYIEYLLFLKITQTTLQLIKKLVHKLFIIALLFISLQGIAQIKSVGIPDIVNYSRLDYSASTQNWAVTQDKRGIMFFGNNDGFLEFDGTQWRLSHMPNNSVVRAIATDKNGTIYVGAYDEFGYLEANSKGILKYISLIEKVPEDLRDFGDIWKIYETENGIIFQSFSDIFLYTKNEIEVIAQRRDFHFSFYVNNELYITERNKGLLKLKDEKLIPIKGSEIFNNNIWTMLPFSDDKILIGSTKNGLFILEDDVVKRWEIPSSEFLKQNQIYCATKVKGYFAFGTILNGLLVIDENGNSIQHINREKGLQNNTILSIYADNYDNLWLGLDNGIDYVVINSPFTNIVNESKLGAGYTSIVYNDKLYLGTNQGLFYRKWKEPHNPLEDNSEFEIVENTQGQVWDLFVYNNTLFCGHNNGTYIINNNKAELVSDIMGGWILLDFPDVENILIQGTYTGLLKYEIQKNKTWKVTKIPGFSESCRTIESFLGKEDYTFWISHGYKGVYKVILDKDLKNILSIDFYNASSGLQTNLANNVLRFNNQIIFTNKTGIYNYEEKDKTFVKNIELMNLFGSKGSIREIIRDNNNRYWFIQGQKMGMVKKLNDGSYKVTRKIFNSFSGNFVASFEHLNPYTDESVIIATEEGFAHFQNNFTKDIEIPFNVLIRSVKTDNDSLLFGGAFEDSTGFLTLNQTETEPKEYNYDLNNLKFEFSATDIENANSMLYSYYLKGFDENWSEWVGENKKEYTNLKEGSYTFNVKARNVFNEESNISYYNFDIKPPWYRSKVAYILYISIFGFILWLIIRIIKGRIDREKRVMQINQTKQLHQQKINHENEVLSAQQEIVKLRNEKLRIENEKNRAEVELKTKELAGYAMQITQKNEALHAMKERLIQISKKVNPDAQKHLQKLINSIEKSTKQKEDWEKFEGYFDQVYEDFTKKLRELYPNLTPNDIKLCAYLRMNLSTKEIAPLLNISIRGVEVSRYRLRKKLDLPKDQNLTDFMMNM